jgi:hypothetical protein
MLLSALVCLMVLLMLAALDKGAHTFGFAGGVRWGRWAGQPAAGAQHPATAVAGVSATATGFRA